MCKCHGELVLFGEPESGLWCDLCALPSGVRQAVRLQNEMTVREMPDVEFCMEHDTAEQVRKRYVRQHNL